LKTAKVFEFGSLHKEFNLFETSGVRTPNLDMLLSALHTIQPTNSERVFSVAGNSKIPTLNYTSSLQEKNLLFLGQTVTVTPPSCWE
jgi:hypothetical protein